MSAKYQMPLPVEALVQDELTAALQASGMTWILIDPIWRGATIVQWEVTVHRARESNPQRTSRDLIGYGESVDEAIRDALKTA